jgi:hypothetical protein
MISATLSFIDERHVLTVIQPMLPLHECANPAPTESATEPLHSVGDSTAVEPLHSVAEFAAEPLQSIANSDVAPEALTKTSCS